MLRNRNSYLDTVDSIDGNWVFLLLCNICVGAQSLVAYLAELIFNDARTQEKQANLIPNPKNLGF